MCFTHQKLGLCHSELSRHCVGCSTIKVGTAIRTLNKQCVRMGSPYLSHTVSIHWVKRPSVFGTISSPIIAKLHKWNDMKSSIDPVVVNPSLLYLPITTGFMYISSANLAMHSSVVFMRNINRNHLHQNDYKMGRVWKCP